MERNDDRIKLIIDTDAGGDDAVAILLALAATEKVDIVAITCTYGNTWMENVEINVLKTLTIANRTDIPVYGGAKKPLIRNYTATDYFGDDGFGDFKFEKEIRISVDKSKTASEAMIELVNKYPGSINIAVLGPTTNIALATLLDSNFTQKVKRLYVMGSKIKSIISTYEFNFSLDPESNGIFLNSTVNVPSLITPWDVAHNNTIVKEWRTDVLGKLNSEVMNFLNKVEAVVLKRIRSWQCADSITIATLLWPDLVTNSLQAHMYLDDEESYKGMVIIETDNLPDKEKNVEIIRTINMTAFKDKLLKYLA